jgi:hypothetical protein
MLPKPGGSGVHLVDGTGDGFLLPKLQLHTPERSHVQARTSITIWMPKHLQAFLVTSTAILIGHFKRWAVLWLAFPAIIEPRGRNIRMPEPLLNLGDVGVVIEGVRGRRSA